MLILVKLKNAGELLWESLDTQERVLLGYLVLSLVVTLAGSAQRKSRDRLKRELLEELRHG